MPNASASGSIRCGTDSLAWSGTGSSLKAAYLAGAQDAKAKCEAHEPPCPTSVAEAQEVIDLLS